jgi:hypothetical protein
MLAHPVLLIKLFMDDSQSKDDKDIDFCSDNKPIDHVEKRKRQV